jgi:hypothetical protein
LGTFQGQLSALIFDKKYWKSLFGSLRPLAWDPKLLILNINKSKFSGCLIGTLHTLQVVRIFYSLRVAMQEGELFQHNFFALIVES